MIGIAMDIHTREFMILLYGEWLYFDTEDECKNYLFEIMFS